MNPQAEYRGAGLEQGTAWLLGLCLATAAGSAAVFPFDHGISRAAIAWEPTQPAAVLVFEAIKSLGKGDTLIVVLLLACLTRMRSAAVQGLIALALIALPVVIIKLVVDRDRPTHSGDSFPSGDTASVVAGLVPLALASRAWLIPVALLVVLVATLRVIAGYHYPSDVFAGAALGLLGVLLSVNRAPEKWLRPRAKTIYWLLAPAFVACVIATVTSGGESPLKAFSLLVLPFVLIAVIRERHGAR